MLKVGSKRRRPPAEVKAEREEKQSQEMSFQAKLAELKAFEAHIDRKKEDLNNKLNAEAILSDLIKTGEVKQNSGGEWVGVQHIELEQV